MNDRLNNAIPVHFFAVLVWDKGIDDYYQHGMWTSKEAAVKDAKRVLNGWPESERPWGVEAPVIVVECKEVSA